MPEFFSYDPHNGVSKYFDYDESTGNAIIRSEMDIDPLLSRNMEARAIRAYDDPRRDLKFYASLPPTVQMELRQKGIDIYSKDETMIRRMFAEINANYPLCKVTDKVHG